MYPSETRIDVVDCVGGGEATFVGTQGNASRVLPEFRRTAEACFA